MIHKKIAYSLLATSISTLVAFFYVINNDWFGKGDIDGFACFTLVLSSLSLFLFTPSRKLYSRLSLILGILVALLLSVTQTIAFTTIVWLLLGPWIGAYSFPILWCWLAGTSAANCFVLLVSDNALNGKHVGMGAGIVCLAVGSIGSYNWLKDQVAVEQNFDIICLVHRPSNVTAQVSDLTKYALTTSEAQAVLNLGLKGSFWTDTFFRVSGSKLVSTDYPTYDFDQRENDSGADLEFMFGNTLAQNLSTSPKVIIIMNHPQKLPFSFKQPHKRSLIVYQHIQEDGFHLSGVEEDVTTKDFIIEGTNFRGFPYSTPLVIELKNRGKFDLHGFQWMSNE